MSSTLLKLYNSSGDLDVLTATEEQYCAYRAAVWLATNMGTSDPGSIATGTATSPERSVGTYTNSYYNQAVGTHPSSSITSGSTATTLKQNNSASYSAVTKASTNWRRPATWDTGNSGIKELTDAEMNVVCDRLLAHMMFNEWSGTNFRIGTSAPAGYSSFVANVFSDTQSSGVTNATYSIYKKTTTPTAPTVARPVCLKRASYPSGAYQGIMEMTDAQIGATFGAWIMARMVAADDQLGRYLLTTSTPATLGYAGTWQSRGSAVDTKDTTSEVDYSATYSGTYTRTRITDYVGNYAGNYVGSVTYSGTYTRTRATNYTRTRVTTYTRTSLRWYIGRRSRSFVGNFVGNFLGDYVGNFAGNYVGNYVNENITFTRTRVTTYTGDFVGNYVGNYLGNYVGTTISATNQTINTYTLYTRVA